MNSLNINKLFLNKEMLENYTKMKQRIISTGINSNHLETLPFESPNGIHNTICFITPSAKPRLTNSDTINITVEPKYIETIIDLFKTTHSYNYINDLNEEVMGDVISLVSPFDNRKYYLLNDDINLSLTKNKWDVNLEELIDLILWNDKINCDSSDEDIIECLMTYVVYTVFLYDKIYSNTQIIDEWVDETTLSTLRKILYIENQNKKIRDVVYCLNEK